MSTRNGTRRRRGTTLPQGEQIPMQPVDKPILCSPYEEPSEYWLYDPGTGEASRSPGRRPAGHWFRNEPMQQTQQRRLFAEENWEELPHVNSLRDDVKRWRMSGYRNATNTTRNLLRHWWREDMVRRLFFCQIEAVETIIYLAEIRMGGKRTSFAPQFTQEGLGRLVDAPFDADLLPLTRMGCKMATGSGKTVVMAMLIAWAFCNRGQMPSDERFPSAVVVVCPNLTIKERLQVLRPDNPANYFSEFDLVPTQMRRFLQGGRVLITNWHQFAPESEHVEGGKSYSVVSKGPESDEAFSRRVLGDIYGHGPIMVLNDEGHHAYRPKSQNVETKGLSTEERREAKDLNEEATVWIQGLDRINLACGVKFCVDLSATPFYIKGSGHAEGEPFPWLVSDFSLVDAIESGIVKIPRIPVDDTTGRPEPRFFRLWKTIVDELQPGQRLSGRSRKPKPEAIWEKAEPALQTLSGQYKERFEYIQDGSPGQDKTPPVMIVVCDNTDIAELFFQNISGETKVPGDGVGGEPSRRRRGKAQWKTAYGDGRVFPELFSNAEGQTRTLRIDSKLLAEAESGKSTRNGAEDLRRIVDSVGKVGEPGERVRCVVSVQMLTEGWDANNVTHILGLRAFESQLLCEQVVGRGLRRMDYTPDPETGMLTEEYVDVYGIPFSVIPYKGRPKGGRTPEDKPKHHVHAMPERKHLEMRFPVVEGYTFDLKKNLVKADVSEMELLKIEPDREPTAVFIRPQVGYEIGEPTLFGPGDFEIQNREAFYASTHIQRIKFQIARRVVDDLLGFVGHGRPDREARVTASRHQLFPQIFRFVDEYVENKVDFSGQSACELGLERYMKLVAERLMNAIQPDDDQGEPPLLPILNRYAPVGATSNVDFKTVQAVHHTVKSHLNQVTLDTKTWEDAAAFRLEESSQVKSYARNDHLGLNIPYEFDGVSHYYEPDFLVKLTNGLHLLIEIKGYQSNQDAAKHDAANRWVQAVNNWGQMGDWRFHVCRNPQTLGQELQSFGL